MCRPRCSRAVDQLPRSDRHCHRLDFGKERLIIDERPEHLCLDTTSLTDLIRYVPTVVSTDHILWGHTTTPFADHNAYQTVCAECRAALQYGYDSLITALPIHNFLLDPATGKLINGGTEGQGGERWPRTQDLAPFYEVNHAAFVAPRATYLQRANRIGERPYLLKQDKITSFDIDWMEDFTVAEALYRQLPKHA